MPRSETHDPGRTIALEEHFATPAFIDGQGAGPIESYNQQLADQLCDLDDQRLTDMDAANIDVQVLSLAAPGTEQLEATAAEDLARDTNNVLTEAIERHPDRFAGFAALPTPAPDAAADELERMVADHDFVGGMINGHVGGQYLDDESFWPILDRAASLGVPLYVHPTPPPQSATETLYTGNFSSDVTSLLSTAGWGWHIDTAIHVLRVILSGAFDQYPNLQVVIGHLGEGLASMISRLESTMERDLTGLDEPIGSYFRENLQYTISGFTHLPVFESLVSLVGTDRILFSADYPFASMEEGRSFLERLPVSPASKRKIAHENAEQLLRV